jgi:protein O-GlcNAc transferase
MSKTAKAAGRKSQGPRPMPQRAVSPIKFNLNEAGRRLFNADQLDESRKMFELALTANSRDGLALYHLAVLAIRQQKHDVALSYAERGILVAPHCGSMWFAKAMAQQNLGEFDGALISFELATHLEPHNIAALINYGALQRHMLQHYKSLEQFLKVLALEPNNEMALSNAGTILTEYRQSKDAIRLFERLVQVNPDYNYAINMLSYERLRNCDWTDFEKNEKAVIDGVRAGKRASKPFSVMAYQTHASDHLQTASLFAQDKYPAAQQQMWRGETYRHNRLRLAYISPDFREHPVGHLMAGVLEHHDRERFETFAFSKGINDSSPLRSRIIETFDHFFDVAQKSPLHIAQMIREHEIDVLIDLAGYTQDTGVDSLAFRPAPVQATFLGYPGTLGTTYVDYIIADRHVIPEDHQQYYCEKVCYLPQSYLPVASSTPVSPQTPTRAECGLPETGAVFCCFSHDFKIHPIIFSTWMQILTAVPGSVLWLSCRGASSQENLRQAAQAASIDPTRLIFADRVPRVEDHLARYRLADLFLDTTPYNAHTTAADALMVGLPVLTLTGHSFPGRVAGSLLNSLNLPQLIAESHEDYVRRAIHWANHPVELQALKEQLLHLRQHHSLFDMKEFCKGLEQAVVGMHEGLTK